MLMTNYELRRVENKFFLIFSRDYKSVPQSSCNYTGTVTSKGTQLTVRHTNRITF